MRRIFLGTSLSKLVNQLFSVSGMVCHFSQLNAMAFFYKSLGELTLQSSTALLVVFLSQIVMVSVAGVMESFFHGYTGQKECHGRKFFKVL